MPGANGIDKNFLERCRNYKRLAVTLPTTMAVRGVLETGVGRLLSEQQGLYTVFLTPDRKDEELVNRLGSANVAWGALAAPGGVQTTVNGLLTRICLSLTYRLSRCFNLSYGALVFRFNHIHGFRGHRQKMRLSRERRQREALAGNFVDRHYGWPFPSSRMIYRIMYRLFFSMWKCIPREIASFLDDYQPDLIVLWHVQTETMKDYSIGARRRGIPLVGVIGSWDRPTTKGPIAPGIVRYIVQNQQMKYELCRYHGIQSKSISVVGWPEMDQYGRRSILRPRNEFLGSLGVTEGKKVLLYTANCQRLGEHEPDIVSALASGVEAGRFGANCILIVRPHPQDNLYEERFMEFHDGKNVVVLPAEIGRLDFMANLLHHADVVISTQGSVSLDAVAMGSCVVNAAFDGHMKRDFSESVRRWYEMDHYAAVIETGGAWVVSSFDELDQAINAYLQDPDLHADGRERLRERLLYPLDGDSSARLVDSILWQIGYRAGGQSVWYEPVGTRATQRCV